MVASGCSVWTWFHAQEETTGSCEIESRPPGTPFRQAGVGNEMLLDHFQAPPICPLWPHGSCAHTLCSEQPKRLPGPPPLRPSFPVFFQERLCSPLPRANLCFFFRTSLQCHPFPSRPCPPPDPSGLPTGALFRKELCAALATARPRPPRLLGVNLCVPVRPGPPPLCLGDEGQMYSEDGGSRSPPRGRAKQATLRIANDTMFSPGKMSSSAKSCNVSRPTR